MAKTKPLPTQKELKKMTLAELNAQINVLGKRINQRMVELERKEREYMRENDGEGGDYAESLFRLKKLAAYLNPKQDHATDMTERFYRGKAMSREQGLSRVSTLVRALSYQTSTLSGVTALQSNRIKGLSKAVFGDETEEELTQQEYKLLIKMLNKSKKVIIDSDSVIELFNRVKQNNVFKNFSDVMKFMEKEMHDTVWQNQYFEMEKSGETYTYNSKDKRFVTVTDDKIIKAAK